MVAMCKMEICMLACPQKQWASGTRNNHKSWQPWQKSGLLRAPNSQICHCFGSQSVIPDPQRSPEITKPPGNRKGHVQHLVAALLKKILPIQMLPWKSPLNWKWKSCQLWYIRKTIQAAVICILFLDIFIFFLQTDHNFYNIIPSSRSNNICCIKKKMN